MNQIDDYTFWVVLIPLMAPFYLAGAFILVEDDEKRKKALIWGGLIGGALFSFVLFKLMNIEVIYGKQLLDLWRAMNPY